MEELVALARSCAPGRGPDEATLVAMRDACGLKRLTAETRRRYSRALDHARATAAG